jgi:hypothetical protein
MTFTVTEGMGHLFVLMGNFLIALANVLLAYMLLIYYPGMQESINSIMSPLVTVFIVTFIISSLYLGIYSIAAATIL